MNESTLIAKVWNFATARCGADVHGLCVAVDLPAVFENGRRAR